MSEELDPFLIAQKQLYDANQISKNSFEEITKTYNKADLNFKTSKIKLEKQRLNLINRQIIAVSDGLVTLVDISKGEGVTGGDYSSKPLFEIAPDITSMEAKLKIDRLRWYECIIA